MEIKLLPLQSHGDDRGSLIALEEGENIPFEIKRVYYLYNTKPGVSRGFHAHKNLKQVVVAVRGSCRFVLDNGDEKSSIILDNPTKGLLIESGVWREMHDFSYGCKLVVLASEHYDEKEYIRNYDDFLKTVKDN